MKEKNLKMQSNCDCDPCTCDPCTCGQEESGKAKPDLLKQLDEARALADSNLNLAKYKQAELENYMKRQKDAVSNAFNDGKLFTIVNILPVLDSFTDAMKIVQDEKNREGLEILYRKFESILQSLGLEEISCKTGDTFDPHIHNCVASGENSENTILEIWQKGYKFAGRVVRPVTVKI